MIYDQQIETMIGKIKSEHLDFKIAMVTDSHLDNSLETTLKNMKTVDDEAGFDCLIHLGDFLNGSLPYKWSRLLLQEQMELFRNAVGKKKFYPVQGNHDGYMDLYRGKINIAFEEAWYEDTDFVHQDACVNRPQGKPYYYVDITAQKLRIIVLYSFYFDSEIMDHKSGISEEQYQWLEQSALDAQSDWTIILCSHDTPFSNFDDAFVYSDNNKLNGTRTMELLQSARREKGFSVAAWFVGHFHGDLIKKVDGIPFILLACETAYVPQLWKMEKGGCFPERVIGTNTEDLWDVVCLDKENKVLKLFRFGSGDDREVQYGTL